MGLSEFAYMGYLVLWLMEMVYKLMQHIAKEMANVCVKMGVYVVDFGSCSRWLWFITLDVHYCYADADTDQETDRLLGQTRTEDDYGFYDEKVREMLTTFY